MQSKSLTLTPASAFFSFWIILFALIFVGGYLLNFLGFAADPQRLFVFVTLGLVFIAGYLMGQRARIVPDGLELLGVLTVFTGAMIYFIVPSLPTLIPPSYSGDPALHYAFTDSIYSTGQIIGRDPGGPSLMAATFAHWLGVPILRAMHPTAALWLALAAAAMYGMVCTLLPSRPMSKIAALVAPFYLFIAYNYFGGLILGAHYFYSQAAGHLFVVAVAFFLAQFIASEHPFWEAMLIASCLGVSVTYQLWLIAPAGMLAWAWWRGWCAGPAALWRITRTGLIIGAILILFSIAARLTNSGFIPDVARLTQDGGAVVGPTIETFGGWLLLFAALGIPVAWRSLRVHLAIVFLASAMTLSLFIFSSHLIFGGGMYWFYKSLFLWVLPLALLSALAIDWIANRKPMQSPRVSPVIGLIVLSVAMVAIVGFAFPPPGFAPLVESDVQAVLWAKENLNTLHVNYIGGKSLFAQWVGVALWGEKYPLDLWIDLARLGPRTFEEWRDTPGWGEYLLISSQQRHPLTLDVRVVFQREQSMIVQKAMAPAYITTPPLYAGTILSLGDYAIAGQMVRPGEIISVTAQIQTHRLPPRHVIWRLQLRDAQNESAAEARIEPFDAQFPMQRWSDNIVLTQTLGLQLPIDARPGVYDLQLGLYFVGSGEPLTFETTVGAAIDVIHLGKIKIALPPVTPHELASLTRIDANIDSKLRLLGYRLRKDSPVRPGDSFQLLLYWQSHAANSPDYTVFVQLLDIADKLIAQRDSAPRGALFPTSFWDQDEIVPDAYTLTIPADAAPGDYRLVVGMYAFPSLHRLPVVDANGKALGDHVELPVLVRVAPAR